MGLSTVNMERAFWFNKPVFLTGHTGFKGSWLSLWLQRLGAKVTGYALNPPTEPSLFALANVEGGMDSVIGDIRDAAALASAMKRAKPEIVIHMAAQPLVRYSYVEPVETYSTNVMGTVHLLESVRNCESVKAVVNVTTDKCYENKEWLWSYRENEPVGGHDPYSSSKACSELVISAYRNSFFKTQKGGNPPAALASVRAGNVIGGGDWASDRLIPDIICAFGEKRSIHLRNPNAIRPWQHVLEPLRGYMSLAQRLYEDGHSFAEAFNFGPVNEDAKPVHWIVEQMANLWEQDASWTLAEGDHPHEANFLKLDISKAAHRLKWHPILRLPQALGMVVDWAKAHQQGKDTRELTLAQINDYMEMIGQTSNPPTGR